MTSTTTYFPGQDGRPIQVPTVATVRAEGREDGPVRFAAMVPTGEIPDGWEVWEPAQQYWPHSSGLTNEMVWSWWVGRSTTGADYPPGCVPLIGGDWERDPAHRSALDAWQERWREVHGSEYVP